MPKSKNKTVNIAASYLWIYETGISRVTILWSPCPVPANHQSKLISYIEGRFHDPKGKPPKFIVHTKKYKTKNPPKHQTKKPPT